MRTTCIRAVLTCAAVLAAVTAPIAMPHAGAEGFPTIDGAFSGGGVIGEGGVLNLTVTGRGGVPGSGVDAVAVNVTVTNPTVPSFLTIWPTGESRPTAANLNFVPNQTVPNMVIAKVGADGQISIFNLAGTADVIVDVLGWFPTGGSYTGLTPARLMDTRAGSSTIDGAFSGGGVIGEGGVLNLTVTGRGGVPGSGVDAVAVNVTVTNPTVPSFLTIWPTGESRPTAANLNFVPNQTVPNMVIAKVGADGQISIFNLAGTADVIVDVLGWFPTGGSYTGLTPARLMDTRAGSSTIDGAFSGGGVIGEGGVLNLTVTGRGGVPGSGVDAVAVNVTVTNPTVPSFLTIWPTGESRPTAANLNFVPNQTVPNMVIAKVGADGQISIFNLAGTADVIVDVLGWFPTGGSYTGLTPARLMDTRIVPPPPPPPPPPTPQVLTFAPGTYQVNAQMPAGRYVSESARSGCYWERLSGFGGTFGEIIANDFRGFAGRVIVDLSASDAGFSFDSDCGALSTYVAPANPAPWIVPGSHHVGAHIMPGTYSATVASGCYWERVTGFGGRFSEIIANDFIDSAGGAVVTISPTDQGFNSDSDCGTWTRMS